MTGWKTIELGQVSTLQRGMDLPKRMRLEGDYPIVTSSGIDDTHSIGPVKGPGVITGRYGTIGRVFFVESDFWPLNTTLYVRDFHGNDPRFIHYLLQTVDFQTHSGKSGVPGVNRNDVHQEFVHIPAALGEQKAIAQTLLDADTLIDSLEQLVTKKRQIKQGTMQELLTGKRRLSGFGSAAVAPSEVLPSDWVRVVIGDIAEVKTGPFGSALHERDYVRSGTPIITVEHLAERGIQGDGAPQVGATDVTRLQAYRLEEGDIVFSRVGSIDRNARVSANEEGWLFSGRLLRLRLRTTTIDSRFLSYLFHGEPFRRQVERVAVGQTMASLNTKLLSSLEVVVPGVDEQRGIADVLSAIDAEIESLESRLTKAHALKQAMAQALLTGRIRLVEPSA